MNLSLKKTWNYYRDIRLNNLTSPKYRHMLLLLYWPFFGVLFWIMESQWPIIWEMITGNPLVYTPVYCWIDAYIPFCEWFVIPYYFWFVFLVGMGVYGVLFDIRAMRHFMWFIILSYSITAVIYFVWPNMQEFRGELDTVTRSNWMIDIVRRLYSYDTNTNVCPSIHVLGSLAVCFAGLHSETLKGWGWKVFFIVSTVLISISTVFLNQHSILDVFAALGVGAVCYVLVFLVICREKKDVSVIA